MFDAGGDAAHEAELTDRGAGGERDHDGLFARGGDDQFGDLLPGRQGRGDRSVVDYRDLHI